MTMTLRQRVRTANAIHVYLLCLQRHRWRMMEARIGQVEEMLRRLQAVRRKLAKCEARDWWAAGRRLFPQVGFVGRDIPYYVQEGQRAVDACNTQVPSSADLYRDLLQVEDEFDELRYYPKSEVLAVSTDPIELEDVFLGRFEIQLRLPGLTDLHCGDVYRIGALDPHPAASNESVTHPHVSDQRLCPGDAGAAIDTALATGRICDFFLLVRSVLTHYNPGSPYVSLENWGGVGCYDCGYITDPESLSWCGVCERDFCDDCASYCRCCVRPVFPKLAA